LLLGLAIIGVLSILFTKDVVLSLEGLTVYINAILFYIIFLSIKYEKDKIIKRITCLITAASLIFVVYEGVIMQSRVSGNFGYANTYALVLIIGLYLASAALRFILFAATAASNAMNAGSRIISAIGSTLMSLPGKMYTWGMNALQSFVNGIINTIPGLSSALSIVSGLFPHSPPKNGPLSTITAANMYGWMSDIASAGMLGFSTFSLNSVATPSVSTSGYGSASLGFDATEINNTLSTSSNGNQKAQIVQYINQEGIMSEEEAATRIVKAVKDQLWKENLIKGKSDQS
jgi:hypothetical protein